MIRRRAEPWDLVNNLQSVKLFSILVPAVASGPQAELPLSQDALQSVGTSTTSTDPGDQPTKPRERLIRALIGSIPHTVRTFFGRGVMKLLHIAGNILRLDLSVTLVVGITAVLAWSYSEFGSKSDPALSVFRDRDKLGISDASWAVWAAFGCLVIALEWRRYSEKRNRATQSSLSVVVAQPLPYDPITSREISFSPAKPIFRGHISEPKGLPSCLGGSSDVWRCRARFFAPSEALPQKVAVKVLRSVFLGDCNSNDARARLLQRLKRETRTWAGLDHTNIVPLIGWIEEPSLSLISPWYEQGNLSRHLKDLSEFKKLPLLLGIAKGLEYLHSRSPPVIHGDLKPSHILLSDRGEPLLTDVGLSTILGEEEMDCVPHHVGGSTRWTSPECVVGELRSCESDVYSFGSLAFTVMTGTLPHAGLSDPQIVVRVCNSKDPKGPVEDWSKYPQLRGSVKDLLEECWARPPHARPSMSAVIQRLTGLLKSDESGVQAISTSKPDPKMGLRLIWLFVSAVIFICLGGSFVIGRFSHSTAAPAREHPLPTFPSSIG